MGLTLPLFPLLGLIGSIILLLMGIMSAWKGYRPARYYLLAWGGFIAMAMSPLLLGQNMTIITYLPVGSIWGVVLLSFTLADRINLIKEEREQARQELNQSLELKVQERTKELQDREIHLREAKEAAEAANQAKSTFLANMNHELRTPLNAILGFTQIVADSQELPNQYQRNLDIVLHSGKHLLTLINQLLNLSKIEANRETFNAQSFDLHEELEQLKEMFLLKASDKGLAFSVEYPSTLIQYIRTDQLKLRQVLINLTNNALKFTESGSVVVRATDPEKNRLHFEVQDTGPGIAPNEIEQLFEAFTQTEVGKQSSEGTGLGLAISRKFAQLMGGEVHVISEIGNGATFLFDIQVEALEGSNVPSEIKEDEIIGLAPDQPNYKILVVDDRWANRQLLVQLLLPLGFDVREAENGKEAIDLWEEFVPHLIWMDMRMPIMDGYEATKHIKTVSQESKTIILALTASTYEEEKALVLSAGCDDFLRKPFRTIDVYEMMRKHLGVQFVYREKSKSAPKASTMVIDDDELMVRLGQVPEELLKQLTHSIQIVDLDTIFLKIDQIQAQDPPLAEEISRMIKEFQYDRVLSLIESILSEH